MDKMGFFDRRLDLSGGSSPRKLSFPPKSLIGWLVLVIIAVFLAQYFTTPEGGRIDQSWVTESGWVSLDLLKQGKIWTLVTHIFLHGSAFHLIANLFMIWFAGQYLNPILGNRRFMILFFGSGILGGLAQMLLRDLPVIAGGGMGSVLIGASGAAFGLMIAFAMLVPEEELFLLLYFVIPIRLRAKNLGRGLVLVSLALALLFLGMDLGLPRLPIPLANVAHWAHLGGALGGFLFMKIAKIQGNTIGLEFFEEEKDRLDLIREARDAEIEEDQRLCDEIESLVDPILEKANKDGLESLSPSERQILDEAQRELERKAGGKP